MTRRCTPTRLAVCDTDVVRFGYNDWLLNVFSIGPPGG
jgi:hypothetical protein